MLKKLFRLILGERSEANQPTENFPSRFDGVGSVQGYISAGHLVRSTALKYSAVLSKNENKIAVLEGIGGWDNKTMKYGFKCIGPMEVAVSDVGSLVFTHGVSATLSPRLVVTDSEGKEIFDRKCSSLAMCVAISADGRLVAAQFAASDGNDCTKCIVIDVIRKQVLADFRPKTYPAMRLELTPDGKALIMHYYNAGSYRYGLDGVLQDEQLWLTFRLNNWDSSELLRNGVQLTQENESTTLSDYREAITLLEAAINKGLPSKDQAKAFKQLGIIHERCEQVAPAIMNYEKALTLSESSGVKGALSRLKKSA